jgi:hypothetical protein
MTPSLRSTPPPFDGHEPSDGRITRRAVLTAGAATAGAALLSACSDDGPYVPVAGQIVSFPTVAVPLDPGAAAWVIAPPTDVELDSQLVARPYRDAPYVPTIEVRSLHDRELIAFRITWNDAQQDAATVAVDGFRDACAVLLGEDRLGEEIRLMGSQDHPVTLLHWKADWQHDVDHGVRTIDDEFPNRSVDVYPPLIHENPAEIVPADYVAAGATYRLPGLHVGNALAATERTTPVEKAIAWGFSTTATAPTQDGVGRGVHEASRWSVVLAKPLRSADDGELTLAPGGGATCAFAVWSGADGDAGSRKSPSLQTYRLVLRG